MVPSGKNGPCRGRDLRLSVHTVRVLTWLGLQFRSLVSGIGASYSVFAPRVLFGGPYVLGKGEISQVWSLPSGIHGSGEKTIKNNDEQSVSQELIQIPWVPRVGWAWQSPQAGGVPRGLHPPTEQQLPTPLPGLTVSSAPGWDLPCHFFCNSQHW